ncbi:hypothetical protein BpHYR1_023910 [Brachionus plicatilis]|uniref:Uncharacterized protein n=1 Tax=Brachionus plicatilis TaxID=10195 RepID=A0A3M7R5K6_BRAPC|nr:hypothetical protein BpHYR1_023910 [Brachionus plicatilis]
MELFSSFSSSNLIFKCFVIADSSLITKPFLKSSMNGKAHIFSNASFEKHFHIIRSLISNFGTNLFNYLPQTWI